MAIDPLLISASKKGKERAIKDLYQQSFGFIMSICLRYSTNRDEAVGWVNICFAKAIEKIDQFDDKRKEPFEAWLQTLSLRTLIDQFRKEKRHDQHIHPSAQPEDVSSEANVSYNLGEMNLAVEDLYRLIAELPESTRIVFNLYAIDGYKHKEISELLNISEGTSKWHLSEARKRLQKQLEELRKRERRNSHAR